MNNKIITDYNIITTLYNYIKYIFNHTDLTPWFIINQDYEI